jgi:hypothetical protein
MPWKHFSQNPGSFMANDIVALAYNNNTQNRTIFDRTLEVAYQGMSQGLNVNSSEPPIFPESFLELAEPVGAAPFNFVFDTDVDDTFAIFDVTLSNVVTPDFIVSNNTITHQQEFYSYYAYDDGSPEAAYLLDEQGSRAALRYVNTMADSLIGMMIWFEAVNIEPGLNSFFPTVWQAAASGPGAEITQGLWEDVIFEPDTMYGWRLFRFLEPVYLPEGPFFIGTVQTIPEVLNIGVDFNSNFNDGNLFFYQNINGAWLPSSASGSLMVRPVFQSSNIGPLSIADEPWKDLAVYPNPARDQLFIDTGSDRPAFIQVFNSSGELMMNQQVVGLQTIDVSSWSQGIYLMRIADSSGSKVRTTKVVRN